MLIKVKQTSNPYREIGLLHNEGLDFVVKKLNSQTDSSQEDIFKATGEFLQTVFDSKSKIEFARNCSIIAKTQNLLELTSFDEVLKNAGVTEKGACFINNMLSLSDALEAQIILEMIKNIESTILDSDISQEKKELPLMAVAVGRASVEYWIDQIESRTTPWKPFIDDEDIRLFKWPWRKDAEGAVGGAISGAISGLGNPLSILGGAVGGALFESTLAIFSKK